MKRINIKLLAAVFAFLMVISACKKDEEKPSNSFYRLSSEKILTGQQQTSSASYEYNGDKLIRKFLSGDGWSEETLISYPEENKIIVSETRIYDQAGTYQKTLEISYSDSKVKNIYHNTGLWELFYYNSDGTINKIVDSAYIEIGIIFEIANYSYEEGKLIQVLKESPGYQNGAKSEYYYENNKLKEIVEYIETPDQGWFVMEKNTFIFTDSAISNITHYYKNMDSWDKSISSDYIYDLHGNLIRVEKTYIGQAEKEITEYTYENGSGNYQQIFSLLVYNKLEPLPVKK
ncbi:MAG: hypothetical protein K9H49_03825 [Bacteroidales bacterium]|nr:hypothetical protein [Bacteroidales bacterium]MCF8389419.1 hypothetical protein [Bacteroidales bacterium]